MISLPVEMPKCCLDCPVWNDDYMCCNILRIPSWEPGKEYQPFEERQKGCPIIENK